MGELDMVLRCMEDDFAPPQVGAGEAAMFSGHFEVMLSELWIGVAYEIFRPLAERKLVPDTDELRNLAHDLRLLRVPLEKHQIANDHKLFDPLMMRRHPANNDGSDGYVYQKGDDQRAHIMPFGFSGRGSVVWHVIDVAADRSFWLERRALSERILALWELETEEKHAAPGSAN